MHTAPQAALNERYYCQCSEQRAAAAAARRERESQANLAKA